MLQTLATIPGYIAGRAAHIPHSLPINYTFSVTTRCNSRCRTCNIWQNKTNELSIGEWEKVLISLGQSPYWITLSGGEPFLYRDLVPLCERIQDICKPGIINIPTNSLTEGISEKVEQITKIFSPSKVIINLSLDGIGAEHDAIRGIPGNFTRFERNLASIVKVRERAANLTIGIHSVVSVYNFDNIHRLIAYAKSLPADQFITEMAEERIELGTVGLPISPDRQQYSEILDDLTNEIRYHSTKGVARLTRAFRLEYYQLTKRILSEERQVIPCYAGWASTHIFADGTVWPCCIRAEALGNLRDSQYDFSKIWYGENGRKIRQTIQQKECWCTLANSSYTNLLINPASLARVIGKLAASYLPASWKLL